jgi:hypothetical protein
LLNKKQIGFGLKISEGLYGCFIGMAVEVVATLVLMCIGFLISIFGFYFWR